MDLNNRLLGTFKDFINDINEFDNEIGEKCKEHYKNFQINILVKFIRYIFYLLSYF